MAWRVWPLFGFIRSLVSPPPPPLILLLLHLILLFFPSSSASVVDTFPTSLLPSHLSHFPDVFVPRVLGSLPPHRPGYDCKINLKSGSVPHFSNSYLLSKDEEAELWAYLDNKLVRGHIRPSSSPAAAPIFYVNVPGKKNRPCVDYRGLNSLTVRDSFPIPLLSQLLSLLFDCCVFSTIDLKTAFNLL